MEHPSRKRLGRRKQSLRGNHGHPSDPFSRVHFSSARLIGAIACLAEFPGHVEMLFDPPSLSAEGRYLIHLYQPSSTWRRVEIDDLAGPGDGRVATLAFRRVGGLVPFFALWARVSDDCLKLDWGEADLIIPLAAVVAGKWQQLRMRT